MFGKLAQDIVKGLLKVRWSHSGIRTRVLVVTIHNKDLLDGAFSPAKIITLLQSLFSFRRQTRMRRMKRIRWPLICLDIQVGLVVRAMASEAGNRVRISLASNFFCADRAVFGLSETVRN